jgi:hypothetical protein
MKQIKNGYIPIIYLVLYQKLIERFKNYREINITDIVSLNRNIIHQIPTKYDYQVIRDLIHYKMLTKINRYKCALILDNSNKLLEPMDSFWAWK